MYSLTTKRLHEVISWVSPKRHGIAGLLACVSIGLTMCQSESMSSPQHFAIDSLLHAQVKWLSASEATLIKTTVLDGQTEEVSLSPKDSLAWSKELEVFQVMDALNKPVNRDRYTLAETSDTKSNLRIRSYSSNDPELPLRYVRIYYHRHLSRLKRIEAEYIESNALYHAARTLTMHFEETKHGAMLMGYTIAGGQKMLLDDTVRYDITTQIRLEKK